MDDLLQKFYESVILYENDVIETGRILEHKVNAMLEPYFEQFNKADMEIIKSLLYLTIMESEQTGFMLGLKCAIKLHCELFQQ